jgi:hypothetical protein
MCSSVTLISINNHSVTDAILCIWHFYNNVTLLVSNPQNTISLIIIFSWQYVFLFIYVGSLLIFIHNGSSICIILCILFRPLPCVLRTCENLSVFIHIVTARRKCSINDSIKSEYQFIKAVNENAECML